MSRGCLDDTGGLLRADREELIVDGGFSSVYLAEDGRVFVHDFSRDAVVEIEAPVEELRNRRNEEEYVDACVALGYQAVLDI